MFFGQAALFFLLMEAFTVFLVIGQIGFFKTFFLWLCSAVLGVLLIQRQGLAMLMRAQGLVNRRGVPVDDFFDGLYLVIAGLLFLIPGFISDFFAFALLIPFVRKYLQKKYPNGFVIRTAGGTAADDSIIDGTYVRVEESVDFIEQKSQGMDKRDEF